MLIIRDDYSVAGLLKTVDFKLFLLQGKRTNFNYEFIILLRKTDFATFR